MNQKQTQRRGLGRGLGALIPTAPAEPQDAPSTDGTPDHASTPTYYAVGAMSSAATPQDGAGAAAVDAGDTPSVEAPLVAGAYFAELPLKSITPNARQPRQVFEEEAMAELVHSIREVGLLQPIVVRRLDEDAADGEPAYELIMGERRWRASQEAGQEFIPAIVRQTGDNDMLRDALLENLHRSQLNPLEEAAAYSQMLEDFGCTHEDLAGRIGRSRPQISNTLRLLKLSPAVQRRVAAGVLSAGHARSLLAVEDGDIQDRLAQRVVAEGISVRGLEEIVSVGDHGGKGTRSARNKPTAPGLADLAERLSDRFETRVKVDLGRSKGKITVEFASMEDLRRIVDVMDPRNRQDRPI
ncbi:ParB/RepB/Spo0J family partition protein [Nocardioides sp. Soil796]|uniref:ParB/RepB/Spo0J family partition protein n=1 Tax=Nocardioides sp. Soil796 TaxID=1736412 RepID=UPI000708F4BD|nr:ParB/RepB/Spo0J family partition protein [Nocardioides sp. Soil796]KRF20382.1 chromosome partitioning protein ParB [Nocardioides sp. Soil796]